MRYRIAFTKRLQSDGADSGMRPSAELDLNLSDGIVAEKEFVEQLETDAQHSQEVMDYEVVDKRAGEFEEAIGNSDLVLEYDVVDVTVTTPDEGPAGVQADGPAGMPTSDPSVGGLSLGDPVILTDAEGLTETESGGIDDLNVTTANDPRLDTASTLGRTEATEKARKAPKTKGRKTVKKSR